MPNTLVPAAATGLPAASLNRAAIMRRAWALFRETYHYPAVPMRSIGWHCFGDMVRRAWAEARQERQEARRSDADRTARIEALRDELQALDYADAFTCAGNQRAAAIRAELACINAGTLRAQLRASIELLDAA